MKTCPCLSGQHFETCCGPYLENKALAPHAEALMRSRYTAFCLKNIDYIQATVAKRAEEDFDRERVKDFVNTMRFQGLEILRGQQPFENRAYIEFLVHCEDSQGHHYHMQELSEFERIEGQWFYVDGRQQIERHEHHAHHSPSQPYRHEGKVGRNDPCPCLSGKKFKKCCGA